MKREIFYRFITAALCASIAAESAFGAPLRTLPPSHAVSAALLFSEQAIIPSELLSPIRSYEETLAASMKHALSAKPRRVPRLGLVGMPGAGKDTHVKNLAQALGVPMVTTSQLMEIAIAQGGYDHVREMRRIGKHVPDEIVIDLVEKELSKPQYAGGYILSGAPRSITQWELLRDRGLLDGVIWLEITADHYRARAAGRLGKAKNLQMGSAASGVIISDPDLLPREDDEADKVENRIRDYEKLTGPAFGYIKEHDADKLITVDSSIPGPDYVFNNFLLPKVNAWIQEWQMRQLGPAEKMKWAAALIPGSLHLLEAIAAGLVPSMGWDGAVVRLYNEFGANLRIAGTISRILHPYPARRLPEKTISAIAA